METYLYIINALGFTLMLSDKIFAIKHRRRIPESMLMGVAAIGGSFGASLAMWAVRHKTRHPRFCVGLPLLLVVHTIILILVKIHT